MGWIYRSPPSEPEATLLRLPDAFRVAMLKVEHHTSQGSVLLLPGLLTLEAVDWPMWWMKSADNALSILAAAKK